MCKKINYRIVHSKEKLECITHVMKYYAVVENICINVDISLEQSITNGS